jgi:hypothetical protein
MRHTSQLSDQIFSGGKVLAVAPGPVVGAAIQQTPGSGEQILIAVVAEVGGSGLALPDEPDHSQDVAADTVYALSLQNPDAGWSSLDSFADYSTDYTSHLPAKTAYPSHYFFNASGTQAVSVKRIASATNVDNKNPWRKVALDVNALLGHANFRLAAVESIDLEGTTTVSGGFGSIPGSFSKTYDLDYTAHGVAADYIGDRLVELHLRVQEHEDDYVSATGDQSAHDDVTSDDYTEASALETSRGWQFAMWNSHSSLVTTRETVNYEITVAQSYEHHFTGEGHGIEFIDLRFDPPVVAYEEVQREGFSTEPDVATLAKSQEKLSWLIGGAEHSVTGWQNITESTPGVFVLPYGSSLFSWGPSIEDVSREGTGTFAVGGPPTDPRVVAAHKQPDFQRNFMFPAGSLSDFGGGPVGY